MVAGVHQECWRVSYNFLSQTAEMAQMYTVDHASVSIRVWVPRTPADAAWPWGPAYDTSNRKLAQGIRRAGWQARLAILVSSGSTERPCLRE